jgi:GNAT superfamily N-acetyltransferase
MPLTIRRATPADLTTVVDFNGRLAEESEGKSLDRVRLTAGVTAVLAAPEHKGPYFLACDGDTPVGQMQVTFEWSDWRNGWFWWIQSVYVVPEARRRGIFRTLFEHVCQAARSDPQVIGLRLYVERDNTRAHQTYLNLGLSWTSYQVMERYPL